MLVVEVLSYIYNDENVYKRNPIHLKNELYLSDTREKIVINAKK